MFEEKIEKLKKLLADNEENYKENPKGYDRGYADGVHDAIVDVFHALNIPTDEEYRN